MNAPTRIPGEPVPSGDNSAGIADTTPFNLSKAEIEDLFVEATHWLDGSPIGSQDEADAVGKLLDLTGSAIRLTETRRKAEVKSFDDAKAEVQGRYNGLIGETKAVTGRAIVLRSALQAKLTPWRQRVEAERRAALEAAQAEAERARRDAALTFQVTNSDDLEGREHAEELAQAAKAAEASAKRAARPVATGLRTKTVATLSDRRAFLNWIAVNRADDLTDWLEGMAQRLCDAKERGLPGLTYTEEGIAR